MVTLLDISNWQHPWPAARAKADGCSEVIVGCQREADAHAIINACVAADLPVVGLYAFLYWNVDTIDQTRTAIRVAKKTGQQMIWLDCENSEDADPNATPWQRQTQLAECVSAVQDAGLNCGIYTGGPFWMKEMGNTRDFSHLPLWYSNYGFRNDATQSPITKVSFGGWTDVAIHQYTSQFPCAGMLLDANYDFMEDEMTPEQLARLERVEKLAYQLASQAWGENPLNAQGLRDAYVDTDFGRLLGELAAHKADSHSVTGASAGAEFEGKIVGRFTP